MSADTKHSALLTSTAIPVKSLAEQLAASTAAPTDAATQLPVYITKRQVLAHIPISSVTLWTWCRTGYFPAPRIMGSKTVWLAQEVFEFIESRPLRQYKAGA